MQIEKDIKQKKQMIPKITKLAENIKRKQNLFPLRLYNNNNNNKNSKNDSKLNKKKYKKNEEEEEEENSFNKSNHTYDNLYILNNEEKNNEYKKFYTHNKNNNIKNSFSFSPQINSNSLLLANNNPIKTFERLTKLSLKEEKNKSEILLKRKYDEKQYDSYNLDLNKKNKNYKYSPKKYKINKRAISLYNKGIENMNNKKKIYDINNLKKENLYQNFTYRPKINTSFSSYNNNNNKSVDSVYVRNKKWLKNKENKNEIEKNKIEIKKNVYSFKPNINHDIMKTDNEFIEKNKIEYVTFLNKLQENNKKINLINKYYNKNNNICNYNTYKTPKKINLEFVIEETDNSNKKSINICTKKIIKEKRNSKNIDLKGQREFYRTSDFFENILTNNTSTVLNQENIINKTTTDNKSINNYNNNEQRKLSNSKTNSLHNSSISDNKNIIINQEINNKKNKEEKLNNINNKLYNNIKLKNFKFSDYIKDILNNV